MDCVLKWGYLLLPPHLRMPNVPGRGSARVGNGDQAETTRFRRKQVLARLKIRSRGAASTAEI
jgi:hypothetical protein